MSATEKRAEKGQLARASAKALLEGFKEGRFTPGDALEEVIAALETVHAACNVIVTPMFESARAEAARATEAWRRGEAKGALAGVPVTVKDLVYVAGVPAKAGAPMLKDFVPEQDGAIVTRLKDAGAVLTCKTTTCESGYKLTANSPLTGIVRNPWRLDRTSGGSSGGAAAAVAAGAGPLAVGTDAVGSIRVPSSFCGVFGIKPTFGLVPRAPGFFPPSWGSLAHTGPIARTVADAALMLEVMAGYDARDAVSLPQPARRFEVAAGRLEGLRIAVSPDLGFAPVEPRVRAAFEAMVGHLAQLGATIVEDHPGLDADVLERTLRPIGYTEQATAVQGRCESRPRALRARVPGGGQGGAPFLRRRLHGGHPSPGHPPRPVRDPVRPRRRARHADRAGHGLRRRHAGGGQDRRAGRRSPSGLVALLLADEPRGPAGGEPALRLRRGRACRSASRSSARGSRSRA